MTRAHHLATFALVLVAGWCLVPACGSSKALDVTAPDDSKTDMDYDEDELDESGKSRKKGGGDEAAAYDPCHEKRCGTPCTQCYPADEGCDEVQVLKECDTQGNCVVAPADCTVVPEEEEKEE